MAPSKPESSARRVTSTPTRQSSSAITAHKTSFSLHSPAKALSLRSSPKKVLSKARLTPRVRRTLRCKTCSFSCTDTKEFTQHQNTAHTEKGQKKQDVQTSPGVRLSARLRRGQSGGEVSEGVDGIAKTSDVSITSDGSTRGKKKSSTCAVTLDDNDGSLDVSDVPADSSQALSDDELNDSQSSTEVSPMKNISTGEGSEENNSSGDSDGDMKQSHPNVDPMEEESANSVKASDKNSSSLLSEVLDINQNQESGDFGSVIAEGKEDMEVVSSVEEGKHLPSSPNAGGITPSSDKTSDSNMPAKDDDDQEMSEEPSLVIDEGSTDTSSQKQASLQSQDLSGSVDDSTPASDPPSTAHKTNASQDAASETEAVDLTSSSAKCTEETVAPDTITPTDLTSNTPSTNDFSPMSVVDKSPSVDPRAILNHLSSHGADIMSMLRLHQSAAAASSAPQTFPSDLSRPSALNTHHSISPHTGSKRYLIDSNVSATLPLEVIRADDDDDDEVATPPPDGTTSFLGSHDDLTSEPPMKKRRKDVSPAKYFEIAEETADDKTKSCTRFGCSRCGNIYKWKKSLNKHWKEKHDGDPGDKTYTPPGMEILLEQGHHCQTEHRRCVHKDFLDRITVKKSSSVKRVSPTCLPRMVLSGDLHDLDSRDRGDEMDGDGPIEYNPGTIPRGPFISGTSVQPAYSGATQSLLESLNGPIVLNNLQPSAQAVEDAESINGASTLLDFSSQTQSEVPRPPSNSSSIGSGVSSAHCPEVTTEAENELRVLNEMTAGQDQAEVLKCPKCSVVLKTQNAYSNHLATHLLSANKHVTKCAVCHLHFVNRQILNAHFMDQHADKLASPAEISKPGAGIQQTPPLTRGLQTRWEGGESEVDCLQCQYCSFTAKWPAELTKHVVSHSDQRPHACLVCGSTYKWKWDLVKHFENAHDSLPNPYKRKDSGPSATATSQSAHQKLETSNTGADGELEEGEVKVVGSGTLPASFLFGPGLSQADANKDRVESCAQDRPSISRLPNFLEVTDHVQESSSKSDGKDSSVSVMDLSPFQRARMSENTGKSAPPLRSLLAKPPMTCITQAGASQSSSEKRNLSFKTSTFSPPSIKHKGSKTNHAKTPYVTVTDSSSELKYKCISCDYHGRFVSDITQHMNNHSPIKPYKCPHCPYRSKWKWDVVKHLKRCGKGGDINDVIDETHKHKTSSQAPPNVVVTQQGSVVHSQESHVPVSTSDSVAMTPVVDRDGQVTLLPAHMLLALSSPTTPSTPTLPTPTFPSTVSSAAQLYANAMKRVQPGSCGAGSSDASTTLGVSMSDLTARTSSNSLSLSHPSPHHLQCGACNYTTSSQEKLTKHQDSCSYRKNKSFKCVFCPIETATRESLITHVQTDHLHNILANAAKRANPKKFQCEQCSFMTDDFRSYIDHRAKHKAERLQEESCHSPTMNGPRELDDARLKHPRKAVRQYRCSQCSFVCSKNTDFIEHQTLAHKKEAGGSNKCRWCSERWETKSYYLDHIVTHPEFNPDEWDMFFSTADSVEDVNNNTDGERPGKTGMDAGSSSSTLESNTSQSSPSHLPPSTPTTTYQLPCEWCGRNFRNIVTLYKHVHDAHPAEIKQLEDEEHGRHHPYSDVEVPKIMKPKTIVSSPVQPSGNQNMLSIQDLNAQLAGIKSLLEASITQGRHPLIAQSLLNQALISNAQSNSKTPGLNLSTKKKTGSLALGEMSSTPTSIHRQASSNSQGQGALVERHGDDNKMVHCEVCGEPQRSSATLLAHMHSMHPLQLKRQLEARHKLKSSPKLATQQTVSAPKEAPSNWIQQSKVQTYQGVPMIPWPVEGTMRYSCIYCNFLHRDPACVARHAQRARHPELNKYKCNYCEHGADELHDVLKHQQDIHVDHGPGITVITCQEIMLPDPLSHTHTPDNLTTPASKQAKSGTPGSSSSGAPSPAALPFPESLSSPPLPDAAQDETDCLPLDLTKHLAASSDSKVVAQTPAHSSSPPTHGKALAQSDSGFDMPTCSTAGGDMPASSSVNKETPEGLDTSKEAPVSSPAGSTEKGKVKALSGDSKSSGPRAQDIMEAETDRVEGKVAATDVDKDSQSPVFSCKHCPFTCSEHFQLRSHYRFHGKKERYPCDFCTFSHHDLSSLVEHRQLHSHEPTFSHKYVPPPSPSSPQGQEGIEPSSTSSSPSHPTTSSVPEILRCKHCPYKTTALKSFNVHMAMHCSQKDYICDFCSWSTENPLMLRKHRAVHADDPEFEASKPDQSFVNEEYTKNSEEFQSKLVDTEGGEKCQSASVEAGSPHVKLSISKKLYRCAHCPFVGASRGGHKHHLAMHAGSGCFACDQCSYRTDHWGKLCQHSMLHEEHTPSRTSTAV